MKTLFAPVQTLTDRVNGIFHYHIVDELVRHFTKDSLRQLSEAGFFEVLVLDELYDISDGFLTFRVCKNCCISVENFHVSKLVFVFFITCELRKICLLSWDTSMNVINVVGDPFLLMWIAWC